MKGVFLLSVFLVCGLVETAAAESKLNNLVSSLLEVSSISGGEHSFQVRRASDGWIFVSAISNGQGKLRLSIDGQTLTTPEAMRYVAQGEHTLEIQCPADVRVEKLVVRSIPELIHCGLGYNPEIKSYGMYDVDFLRNDILPNITTLIVPNSFVPPSTLVDDWHGQGKKFVAEVGVNSQLKTASEHAAFWSSFYEKAPFLDGIIINEFIVNRPVVEWAPLTPDRLARMDEERKQYETYDDAMRQMKADNRYRDKMVYAYVGGSGKKLNQEIIGTNLIHAIAGSGYRVALERYLHEMSSEQKSREALQLFVDGIADWEAKEPGIREKMIIAFGLFSMPPGSINKQPNVDYHVWMDQQMNVVANHPALAGIAGLEWWTSLLADEETVRFVGRLYRHYGIEGKTNLLTRDPLFLTHIQNADFEKGTEGWTLRAAENGSIAAKTFPRYGRIEGRFMGLGRPADPEHIGDTFLWMKRSDKGPNSFSQTIRGLEPGRLYSMKMLSCDYSDLINPREKKKEDANAFIGSVTIEGVELDQKRSFSEMCSSSPEPKIPVWITYHWKVFKATSTSAQLTVSDWPAPSANSIDAFGQEQTFNFVEIQPYHH